MGENKQAPEVTVDSHYAYRGRIIDLRLDTVRLPNGKTTTREIIEHRGAVAMVPLDDEGNVLLVRQFRKPAERYVLEIPAGTREADEPVAECLHRELREETGFSADQVERLAGYYSAVGFCTEFIEVYLATGLRPSAGQADEDEFIELVKVPLGEALAMVGRGEIVDGKTIIGLLSVQARGLVEPRG
ncbi:MAG: NUDIX domain-containing protein [Chloroflexota bacterium]